MLGRVTFATERERPRVAVSASGAAAGAAGAAATAPRPAHPTEAEPQVRTVVIDPGHGGENPGARGAGGSVEKDIALQIARRLRAMIDNLMKTLPENQRRALRLELDLLDRTIEKLYPLPEDLAVARIADTQGLGGSSGTS